MGEMVRKPQLLVKGMCIIDTAIAIGHVSVTEVRVIVDNVESTEMCQGENKITHNVPQR